MGSFGEMMRQSEIDIERNRQELRAEQERVGADMAREIELELRAISPEVQVLNDKAQFEIYGSGKAVWLDSETYEELPQQAGKIAEIANKPDYQGHRPDFSFADSKKERREAEIAARQEAEEAAKEEAKNYERSINELLTDGFELCQAKLIMDLREEDANALKGLERKATKLAMTSALAGMAANKAQSLMLERISKAAEGYMKADAVRLKEIKEQGLFSRAEYDAQKAQSTNDKKLGGVAASGSVTSKPNTKKASEPKPEPATSGPEPAPPETSLDLSDDVKSDKDREKSQKDFENNLDKLNGNNSGKPERLNVRLEVGERSEKSSYHNENEDTVLNEKEIGLFGVFDGLGGHKNGEVASRAAAENVREHYEFYDSPLTSEEDALDRIKKALETTRTYVRNAGDGGDTTGVFGKVETINGEPYLVWANAGDSRLFLRNGDDAEVEALSTDQSTENIVHNTVSGVTQRMPDEFGVVKLEPGARIMFCSDGITGDYGFEILTGDEIKAGFSVQGAQAAADKFIEISRKEDDKSVLVIDLETDPVASPARPASQPTRSTNPTPESDFTIVPHFRTPEFRKDHIIELAEEDGSRILIDGQDMYRPIVGDDRPFSEYTDAEKVKYGIGRLKRGEPTPELPAEGETYKLDQTNTRGETEHFESGRIVGINFIEREAASAAESGEPADGGTAPVGSPSSSETENTSAGKPRLSRILSFARKAKANKARKSGEANSKAQPDVTKVLTGVNGEKYLIEGRKIAKVDPDTDEPLWRITYDDDEKMPEIEQGKSYALTDPDSGHVFDISKVTKLETLDGTDKNEKGWKKHVQSSMSAAKKGLNHAKSLPREAFKGRRRWFTIPVAGALALGLSLGGLEAANNQPEHNRKATQTGQDEADNGKNAAQDKDGSKVVRPDVSHDKVTSTTTTDSKTGKTITIYK